MATMDIAAWLRALGLERHAEVFRANDVRADVLPDLTDAELRELGVSLGDRKRLLKAIAALRSAIEPVAKPRAEAERRQLTVMFVDLVGSTALAARLDPEEMREILRAYRDAVTGEVARYEGHVAKLMGDGVLCYFGWPRAHEDAAERAVRAGLAAVAAVARLRAPDGTPLAARVGIATGLVVVGDLIGEGAAQEEAVVGETPNLAARLQAVAPPGGVVLAEGTRRLLGGLFELEDLGARELKGFAAPALAWRVVAPRVVESRFEAHQAGLLLPLVGRDEELALLLRRWWQAAKGEGQVVLLAGEPGIGKSRVALELRERLGATAGSVLRLQCSPYYTDSALHPVIDYLERAAGFTRDDEPEAKLAKLEVVLAASTHDMAAAAPLLAAMLAIPTEGRYPPLDLTPQRQKMLTLQALVDQLAGLAARRPALVVLEDAHWLDPTTQELMGLVVDRAPALPVLVVITFRSDYLPPWSGRAHVTALTLARLGRHETAAIVDGVTGEKALPAAVLEQIRERTDGVPLFVEELTKTILESGLLRDTGDRFELDGPLPALAIPATLHDSLMARLDRLASAKVVAQIGAAIGREFSRELIAAVARLPEHELDRALSQLAAADLIFRGAEAVASYTFKHALIRDAAYQSLLKSRRQQLHARIATVLEERFPETAETQPEVLARHCTEAGLVENAIAYWHKAGRQALARSAMAEAVAQLTRGLELLACLPAGRDRDRKELDLRIALGRAFISTKGWAAPEVARTYERARELCSEEAQHPQLLAALSGLQAHHLHRSGAGVGLKIAEELLRSAERQQHANVRAAGHLHVGLSLLFNGQLHAALAHFEQALALYDPADRTSAVDLARADIRVVCLLFTALILLWQGYPDRALACGGEAFAAAHELRHAFTTSQTLYLTCWLHQVRGEPRIVRQRADAMMSLAAEHGLPTWSASATIFHGWALADGGATEPGIAQMRQGLAATQALGVQQHIPGQLGLLAGIYMKQGDPTEALNLVDDALVRVEHLDERWFEAELHRLRGEALLALSCERSAEAEISFRKAIEVAQRQDAKWWELRAATSLARLWAERSERPNAYQLLARVYGWFTEGFDTPDLKAAKGLLDSLT